MLCLYCVLMFLPRCSLPDLPDQYRIPVKDNYEVHVNANAASIEWRSCLIESSGGKTECWICEIDGYDVQGDLMVAFNRHGLFTLVLSESSKRNDIEYHTDIDSWNTHLIALGLDAEGIHMISPHERALQLGVVELQPWRYKIMNGLLCLSDEDWGALIMLLSIPVSLLLRHRLFGAVPRRLLGACIGLCAAVIGAGILWHGGPGFFVSLVLYPMLCAWAARGLIGSGDVGHEK
jgi:hypothetical protein